MKAKVHMMKAYRRIVNLILIIAVLIAGFVSDPIPSSAASEDTIDTMTPIEQTPADIMEVHFIDVGQGASALIRCGGHAMLIDAGDISQGINVQNYLDNQGITKLDYLILTHSHADHIGGVSAVINKFDIDKVFFSYSADDSEVCQILFQALDNKRLNYETPEVGAQYALGSAMVTILAPNKEYDDLNDTSIALIIQNGNNKFLFTGDAGEEAEKDILDNGISISADVYHAGHHGSKNASSRDFVKAVSPGYVVISCGADNIWGLPHVEVLDTMRIYGAKVYRTDEKGTIIAVSDGRNITFTAP